ncbi:MAG TPA: redoxin domain-containing protein, partial [Candidatus Baltobacteraceae bacterium]|nr:redoxin domain-containing protein [Candidatus Baltobacteraceae bacterium]
MRPLAPAAFALASLLSIASPAGADAPAAAPPEGPPAALTGPQLGAPAPAFTLKTLSGQTVSLESYRGKTLVINVWATWCPPCRQEMPDLISSYAKLRPSGVEFLGVDSTEEAPIVRAYVVAKGLAYPQAIDSDKRFSNAYDIQYFPTTLVIDPQGILRARYIDVIVPAQLAALTSAAQAGRSVTLVSPLQAKIDALLSDPSFDFSGDAAGVLAVAKKADAAIAKAEDLMNDSDAAGGNATDLLRTRSEEAALRDRAIQALAATTDSTPADNAFLARMRGDAARDREAWADALDAYQVVLALEPDNQDALDGVAMSAGRLEKYDVAIAADEKLATLNPTSAEALVDLGLAYGKVKRF